MFDSGQANLLNSQAKPQSPLANFPTLLKTHMSCFKNKNCQLLMKRS